MSVIRAIGVLLAGLRAVTYAWLEEVRFRTGVLALAGLAAVVGCVTVVAVIAAQDGSLAAAHRSVAGPARMAAAPPPARPATSAREPRGPAPGARRTSSARRAATFNNTASYIGAGVPRADGMRRPGHRALGRRDHLTWHRWWHHGHSPWRYGHSPWHQGRGPHRFDRHHPGQGRS